MNNLVVDEVCENDRRVLIIERACLRLMNVRNAKNVDDGSSLGL